MYIDSDNINVYPTVKRQKISNLMTEKNITDISNNIVDYPMYIQELITDPSIIFDNPQTKFILSGIFILNGYYITINNYEYSLPEETTDVLKVSLKLNNLENNVLQGLDQNDQTYNGVILDIKNSIDDTALPIGELEYDTSTSKWLFKPADIKKKINANTTSIDLSGDTGLIEDETYQSTFIDWLTNSFILDDGNI